MKKKCLIVFCGMDGTGKTTLAKKVGEYLKKNSITFQYNHSHGYAISQNSFAVNDRQINRFRLFFSLLTPLTVLDNFLNYYLHYRPVLKKKILICDRYFYDKVVRLTYYRICPRWLSKIYLRLLPKPDYTFFLDTDPQIAIERKGEYSIKEQKIFRKEYRFVAKILSAPIINTSQTIDKCLIKIINHLEK